MIILKTFALSQIVFVSQNRNILPTDIKHIESICYNFVWGGKRDRIARAVLKNKKAKGGINGVDVDCFLKAIKIKQFAKADSKSFALKVIQDNPKMCEEIKSLARNSIYKLSRAFVDSMDDKMSSVHDKITMANFYLNSFVKPGSKADALIDLYEVNSYAKLVDSTLPRRQLNSILKTIPLEVRATLSLVHDYEYRVNTYGFFNGLKPVCLLKIPAKQLQYYLKVAYKKIQEPRQWLSNAEINWSGIWHIKNPTLRTCRYKIAHKDVFCNYKRFRCKMTDNPLCAQCGQVETIEHQLLTCDNAIRMWNTVRPLISARPRSIADIVCCTSNPIDEIIISVIIKLLLQIDRSSAINSKSILLKIRHFLTIEKLSSSTNYCSNIINTINDWLLLPIN